MDGNPLFICLLELARRHPAHLPHQNLPRVKSLVRRLFPSFLLFARTAFEYVYIWSSLDVGSLPLALFVRVKPFPEGRGGGVFCTRWQHRLLRGSRGRSITRGSSPPSSPCSSSPSSSSTSAPAPSSPPSPSTAISSPKLFLLLLLLPSPTQHPSAKNPYLRILRSSRRAPTSMAAQMRTSLPNPSKTQFPTSRLRARSLIKAAT